MFWTLRYLFVISKKQKRYLSKRYFLQNDQFKSLKRYSKTISVKISIAVPLLLAFSPPIGNTEHAPDGTAFANADRAAFASTDDEMANALPDALPFHLPFAFPYPMGHHVVAKVHACSDAGADRAPVARAHGAPERGADDERHGDCEEKGGNDLKAADGRLNAGGNGHGHITNLMA